MNKNTIILGVVALIVLAGGVYASMAREERVTDRIVGDGSGVMTKGEAAASTTALATQSSGSYESYSAEKLARAEAGDVVLFFHASWCPSCRGLNASIEGGLGSIPEGVTILKTDYDEETELRKMYGVTYQHTLVQVDKDGGMIKKWSGSPTLERLLSQIQ